MSDAPVEKPKMSIFDAMDAYDGKRIRRFGIIIALIMGIASIYLLASFVGDNTTPSTNSVNKSVYYYDLLKAGANVTDCSSTLQEQTSQTNNTIFIQRDTTYNCMSEGVNYGPYTLTETRRVEDATLIGGKILIHGRDYLIVNNTVLVPRQIWESL